MKVIFIFIDGLGLGKNDSNVNPCANPDIHLLPCVDLDLRPVSLPMDGMFIPTDASLGVKGLPQSATGQGTLFSGINCARKIGKHLQGFPNQAVRDILKQRSILKEMGHRPVFVNAFRPLFFKLPQKIQWHLSASTVTTLAAGLPFFGIEDLKNRHSIYHDFTNSMLIKRGFDVPLFSADEAANILAKTVESYDFILYEYFLTDRAGHSQDMQKAMYVMYHLDRFLSVLLDAVDLNRTLVLVTSDHGNVEDLSVKTHTVNRIPTFLWGYGKEEIQDCIGTLEDVAPAVLRLFGNGGTDGNSPDE